MFFFFFLGSLFTPFFYVTTNAARVGTSSAITFYCLSFINAGSTIGRLLAGAGDYIGRYAVSAFSCKSLPSQKLKNSHILQDESRHLFLPRLRHPPPRFLDPPLHCSRHHRLLRRLWLLCRSIHLPHTSVYRTNLTSSRGWTPARSRMGNRIRLCPLWTAD